MLNTQKVTQAQSKLNELLQQIEDESDRVGIAFQEAAITMGNDWIDALANGVSANFVQEVSSLINRLQLFQEKARDVLPISHGGFGGHPKSLWIERLGSADVSVYEAEDLPGHFGFTGCDADNFMSFDEALHAALIATPDVVGEVEGDADESRQSERVGCSPASA